MTTRGFEAHAPERVRTSTNDTGRTVVVGNGMAATRLVEELVARGHSDVTVLGDEPHPPYNRILLSAVLEGTHRPESLTLREPDWYADHGVDLRLGARVLELDRERREVMLVDGTTVGYDRLVLATGSIPTLPPIRGLVRMDGSLHPKVHAFRSLDDCQRLVAALPGARDAVVVGGGLLGLQVARALSVRGLVTEVVEGGEHLLRSQVGAPAGDVLKRGLERLGTTVYTGARAVRLNDNGLVLDNGFTLETDLVVLTAGGRPSTALARRAGLTVRRGVVVDDQLRSVDDERVHAIGDCADHEGRTTGFVPPAWEQAGLVAGHLAGETVDYRGSRSVARLRATGLDVAVLGDPERTDGQVVEMTNPVVGTHRKLVVRDGVIVGATLVGDLSRIGLLTQHYDRGTVLGPDEPGALLLGDRPAQPAHLPDDAEICACAGVTAGRIRACTSLDEVTETTRATTGCGGCAPAVRQLLATRHPPLPGRNPNMSPHLRKSLVVVGHGMVGHRFVQAAIERGLTEAHDIVVIGEEPRAAYDRVALTSFFEVGADELSLLPTGVYDDPRVRLSLGTAVKGFDPESRTLLLTDATGQQSVIGYDELVLATGAAPFVPPVPGHDLEGCFVYRTIEDLEAIREAAAGATVGAVIGGGLLGLEAANALAQLGLETHVVEMAPRLMAVQVDAAGGATLARHIEKLGLTIHTGAITQEVLGEEGRVTGLALKDEEPVDAQVVVFSAGIRPRDALAGNAGLDLAERGGVLVDERCRTSDPHVWAIGECAAPGGRMYGLVAPGHAMAEVVVDALLGGPGAFTGADMSTKLKLLGVDVASFGDAHAATPGALELVFADAVAGVYKKLVVSSDGRQLLGGVLVGDATAYGVLRPMVASGIELPDNPEELILPIGRGGAEFGLPDEAVVCSCNNVSKADIVAAAEAGEKTTAGTTCGSCKVQTKKIIEDWFEAQGRVVDRSLCEHFPVTRQELFDVVAVHGYTRFDDIIEAHGTGRGCDVCKPTVASILASQLGGHVLEKPNRTLQDTNDAYLANIQRNGTYSVVPRIPGGEITPEKLIVIGEVARDFDLYTKITGGQRIDLFGARLEQLPLIWSRLVDAGFESGHAYGKSLRTVKSCVGSTWCRYGVQDSTSLAIMLEERYRGLRSPHKLKGGVSGCARECAEARSKDFGVIATEKGWNLYVAGNGGANPAHARLLAGDLNTETLVRYLDRFLMYYVRTADRLQRTAPWVDSLDGGLDRVREVVVDDALGLGSELEAAMAAHVDGYFDEWKATLDDPEKLARFVSFVNAPGVPDPNISFRDERGQVAPADSDGPVALGATIPVGAPR